MEKMVNSRLVWFLESTGSFSRRQFGFRQNLCTIDPLTFLKRFIQTGFIENKQAFAVFFDLQKAYDNCWRGGIIRQLVQWSISGRMLTFLKAFLTDRLLKVRVGTSHSRPFTQEEGVPQGSVLSVTLFAAAINGIVSSLPVGIQGSLFVDDFVIYCKATTAAEACLNLQAGINSALQWATNRGFVFSPEKTKALRFTRSTRVEVIPTLTLGGTLLEYVPSITFLGVVLDSKLLFKLHIDNLVVRLKRDLNLLRCISSQDWGAERAVLLTILRSLCRSKIDYACQIYGSAAVSHLQKITTVYNSGLRVCTGALRTSPVESLYVDAQEVPLELRRAELTLRYMVKISGITTNPNSRYIFHPNDSFESRPRASKPPEVRLHNELMSLNVDQGGVCVRTTPRNPPWKIPPITSCHTLMKKSTASQTVLQTTYS